jgi:hypothetical protein
MMQLSSFSPAQCRAARAYLTLSTRALAYAAGLDPERIEAYEAGRLALSSPETEALNDAFARQDLRAFTISSGLEGIAWTGRPCLGAPGVAAGLLAGMLSAFEDRGANAA